VVTETRTVDDLLTISAADLLLGDTRRSQVPEPTDAARPYGPNTGEVEAIIARLPTLDSEAMVRCRAAAIRLGSEPSVGGLYRAFDRVAISDAVSRTSRRPEFLAAFWDAGRAGADAWADPVNLAHFWNDNRHGTMTEAGQMAAAATVVADALDPVLLRLVLTPWKDAAGPWPEGALGPNQDQLLRFFDRIGELTTDEARAVAAAWWPPEEDDPVWRTYDDSTARQVRLLRKAIEASRAADDDLSQLVLCLADVRRGGADLRLVDRAEEITVLPKLRQATHAAALEVAFGDLLDAETREALRAAFNVLARP